MVSRFSIVALLVSALLVLGCGDQAMDANEEPSEEELPSDVSYAEDIQPIFDNSCGGAAGCHFNNEESGVELTTYQDVTNSVGDQYGEEIVDPGNPGDSPLVDKITQNPEFGVRMPQNGDPLSEEEINLIRGWINEGANNN